MYRHQTNANANANANENENEKWDESKIPKYKTETS